MRTTLSREALHPLMEAQSVPCISLFMPTDRMGIDRVQDQLRIRRLIREIEDQLREEVQLGAAQIAGLLDPLRALVDDKRFWQQTDDGLAIFRSSKEFRAFQLPFSFHERVVVDDHFYLKPLLPLLMSDGHFYLLALSQNAVRLLTCTQASASEVKLPEQVPRSLADFLGGEERANELQAHSSASFATVGKGGRHPVVFHGQGVGTDEAKDDILRYFQHIDRGLHQLLRDETAPLVLAGVGYLLPIYRQANSYPHLLEQGVIGNPDKLTAQTLRGKAWALVEPHVWSERWEAAARYRGLASTEHTSRNISEIVPAASYGRVASVFVASDREQWGIFDPATGVLWVHEQRQSGDQDLLDLAATQTLLHGGAVYALESAEMPDDAPLVAVFRYPPI